MTTQKKGISRSPTSGPMAAKEGQAETEYRQSGISRGQVDTPSGLWIRNERGELIRPPGYWRYNPLRSRWESIESSFRGGPNRTLRYANIPRGGIGLSYRRLGEVTGQDPMKLLQRQGYLTRGGDAGYGVNVPSYFMGSGGDYYDLQEYADNLSYLQRILAQIARYQGGGGDGSRTR